MVSRRNFFTITLIMLVLLFMFQMPEVVKNQLNNYEVNQYAEETGTALGAGDVHVSSKEEAVRDNRYIVYIGGLTDGMDALVEQWCAYSGRYLDCYGRLGGFEPGRDNMPEAVLLDSGNVKTQKDVSLLCRWAKKGVNIVFCNLPDLVLLKKSSELRELMGIRAVLSDNVNVKGIRLFDGLLLGGEKIYRLDETMEASQQDLGLSMPWCTINSGAKMYMVGMLSDDIPLKNENLPAVIWRNSVGSARIFTVNGDYLEDNTGLGFLEAMMYESESYELYPVINAQNLVILNYPSLACENEEEMMRRYSQSQEAVYRDIVWPGLAATAQKSSRRLTCMIAPQLDYGDGAEPDSEMLTYYMKLLKEQNAEVGLSAMAEPETGMEEKLETDGTFFGQAIPDYAFLSFYRDGLDDVGTEKALRHSLLGDVRTVYCDYSSHEPLVAYHSNGVTRQCATNDGYSHTFSEDIRMNSIETAIGYTSISVDIGRVAFPETESDNWEKLYERFSSNTNTYWHSYEKMAATTLAQSDERIRRFLALDYRFERDKDVIQLEIGNFDTEAWFVLRTHGEQVGQAEGAEYEELEEDAYLIHAVEPQVTLRVKTTSERIYY